MLVPCSSIASQLSASIQSRDKEARISTYRTEHGAEADFICELGKTVFAVEVKASQNVTPADLRGLKKFSEYYGAQCRPIVLYPGATRKQIGPVEIRPWQQGLKQMGL